MTTQQKPTFEEVVQVIRKDAQWTEVCTSAASNLRGYPSLGDLLEIMSNHWTKLERDRILALFPWKDIRAEAVR